VRFSAVAVRDLAGSRANADAAALKSMHAKKQWAPEARASFIATM
jgi:hypothetical protein